MPEQLQYDESGYSWLGRRPRLAVVALLVLVPLYVFVGVLKGIAEVSQLWSADFRDAWMRM